MKWFKHISDSLDDPFIFKLLDDFGDFGYLAFFGILEIYSREFKPEKGWKLTAPLSFFRSKLHQTSVKRVRNFLQSENLSKKWDVQLDGDDVTIFIPKFIEIIDEWTQRRIKENAPELGSKSGDSPLILNHDKEEEVRSKNEEEDNNPPIPPPKKPAKKFDPPSRKEFVQFFIDNGFSSELGERAFDYYSNGDPPWTDSTGKPVRSWKQKAMAVWMKPENREGNQGEGKGSLADKNRAAARAFLERGNE